MIKEDGTIVPVDCSLCLHFGKKCPFRENILTGHCGMAESVINRRVVPGHIAGTEFYPHAAADETPQRISF